MSTPPDPPPRQWSAQPPQPAGQVPQGQAGGHPPYGPPSQPPWPPQGGPKRGRGLKLALGAATVIAVAAVAVATTLLFTHSGSGKDSSGPNTAPPSSGSTSGIASANDTGPVTIITDDPSCAAWSPIQNMLADTAKNGWLQRDPSIPADAWTSDTRAQYQAVGQAMRTAADQTVPLAKLTPHRVMRELYEQFIAYARAYVERIPTYTPPDDQLARAANGDTNAVASICTAISYGSAAARAPLIPAGPSPAQVASVGDLANPKRFLNSANPACADWKTADNQFIADTAAWREISPDIPAGQLSPEQKAINDAVAPVMRASADTIERLGQRSGNPTFQDFAVLTAQYRRAFAQAAPTYTPADTYLQSAASAASGMVLSACEAAGGSS